MVVGNFYEFPLYKWPTLVGIEISSGVRVPVFWQVSIDRPDQGTCPSNNPTSCWRIGSKKLDKIAFYSLPWAPLKFFVKIITMNGNLFTITQKICGMVYGKLFIANCVRSFFKLFTHLMKHHGKVGTVKYLKQMRLHVTRYLCGSPLLVNDMKIGLDKSGWPKRLLFLKPYADSNQGRRFLLSILNLTRTLVLSDKEAKAPDYTTITAPGPTRRYVIPRGVVRSFVKEYGLRASKPKFSVSDVFLSVKGSPLGKASLSAVVAILALSYTQMQWIFDITCPEGRSYFTRLYNWSFEKATSITGWASPYKDNVPGLRTGELSLVMDPECKVRVIAMFDYISQLFLKPIHTTLFSLLKRLPCDRTFTQDPKRSWKDDGHSFWSMDLSAATDRFPIHVQISLLEEVFKDVKFVQSWANLLTKRDFVTPQGGVVRYAAGQPMGGYSSWPAFTLSHHLVVYYCGLLAGIPRFSDYIVLGDDIVIKNDKVAYYYIRVMGRLGVELSTAKTHVSKDTYEFAKRWFKAGVEITGIPIKGIVENINNPFIVFTSLYDFFKIKGNVYTYSSGLVSFVNDLYRGLRLQRLVVKTMTTSGRKPKKKFSLKNYYLSRKFMPRLRLFALGLDMAFGYATVQQMRLALCELCGSGGPEQFPWDMEIRSFMERAISKGLSKVTTEVLSSTTSLISDLKLSLDRYKLLDVNEFRMTPVFDGIYNHTKSILDTSLEWDSGELSLAEVAKKVTRLDILSILSGAENKISALASPGRIFTKGLNTMCFEVDVVYGSSTTESTWTADLSLHKSVKSVMAVAIMNLDRIREGTYVERTPESVISAWENFKID